jgi:hypothetical protein
MWILHIVVVSLLSIEVERVSLNMLKLLFEPPGNRGPCTVRVGFSTVHLGAGISGSALAGVGVF